jgi:hypothetical protein
VSVIQERVATSALALTAPIGTSLDQCTAPVAVMNAEP